MEAIKVKSPSRYTAQEMCVILSALQERKNVNITAKELSEKLYRTRGALIQKIRQIQENELKNKEKSIEQIIKSEAYTQVAKKKKTQLPRRKTTLVYDDSYDLWMRNNISLDVWYSKYTLYRGFMKDHPTVRMNQRKFTMLACVWAKEVGYKCLEAHSGYERLICFHNLKGNETLTPTEPTVNSSPINTIEFDKGVKTNEGFEFNGKLKRVVMFTDHVEIYF